MFRSRLLLATLGLALAWSLGTLAAEPAAKAAPAEPTAKAEPAGPAPLHQVSSELCKTCHADTFKQWKGSMHAQSTPMADPIHGLFYQSEVGDPTQEGMLHKKSQTYPVCIACHAPNAARDKTTKLDAKPAYTEGVNCVACHTLKDYKGIQGPDGKLQLGIKAYELSDRLQAPHGFNQGLQALTAKDDLFGGAGAGADSEQKPNPHLGKAVTYEGKEIQSLPMDSNPRTQKTSDACMGCHDQRNNPHGVPLCLTGTEYQTSKSQVNCLACHMPINEGKADHAMGGGHDPAMLKRAIVFDLKTETAGDKLRANLFLRNQQPHSLPTGAPFRNIFVKVVAYNAKGEAVWQSTKGHPKDDDPQGYLDYLMADDEGKEAMPPVATKLGSDTRLKPHEERTLVYEFPAKGVVLVRAEAYYQLLWQVLVDKFGQLPDAVKKPVLIADAERKVGG